MRERLEKLLARLERIRSSTTDPLQDSHLSAACLGVAEILERIQHRDPIDHCILERLCNTLVHLADAGFTGNESKNHDGLVRGNGSLEVGLIDAELLAQAHREIDEEKIVSAIRELEQNGGYELADFLPELERAAQSND